MSDTQGQHPEDFRVALRALVRIVGVSDRDWNAPERELPPEGVEVATINSWGQVQNLVLANGLWWFPDRSMYCYYVPEFWKSLEVSNV